MTEEPPVHLSEGPVVDPKRSILVRLDAKLLSITILSQCAYGLLFGWRFRQLTPWARRTLAPDFDDGKSSSKDFVSCVPVLRPSRHSLLIQIIAHIQFQKDSLSEESHQGW